MNNTIPDHPIIRNMERTGYPGEIPEYLICPVCKEEADTFYVDIYNEVVGCYECIKIYHDWEIEDCGISLCD